MIDHTTDRLEEVIGQVDLVFDTAGGDRLARSPYVIRPGGRLVSIAAEPPRELAILRKIAATYFVVTPDRKQLIEIAQLVDDGVLRPTLDRVFPLSDAREAFERSLVGHQAGKNVLRVADD